MAQTNETQTQVYKYSLFNELQGTSNLQPDKIYDGWLNWGGRRPLISSLFSITTIF